MSCSELCLKIPEIVEDDNEGSWTGVDEVDTVLSLGSRGDGRSGLEHPSDHALRLGGERRQARLKYGPANV